MSIDQTQVCDAICQLLSREKDGPERARFLASLENALRLIQQGDTEEKQRFLTLFFTRFGHTNLTTNNLNDLRQFFYEQCYRHALPFQETDALPEETSCLNTAPIIPLFYQAIKERSDVLPTKGTAKTLPTRETLAGGIQQFPEHIPLRWRLLGRGLAICTALFATIIVVAFGMGPLLYFAAGLTLVSNLYMFWDTVPRTLHRLTSQQFWSKFRQASLGKHIAAALLIFCALGLTACTIGLPDKQTQQMLAHRNAIKRLLQIVIHAKNNNQQASETQTAILAAFSAHNKETGHNKTKLVKAAKDCLVWNALRKDNKEDQVAALEALNNGKAETIIDTHRSFWSHGKTRTRQSIDNVQTASPKHRNDALTQLSTQYQQRISEWEQFSRVSIPAFST